MDDIAPMLRIVFMQTVVSSGTRSSLLVHSQRASLTQIKPMTYSATRARLTGMRGEVDVIPARPIHIITTIMLKKETYVTKHILVAWAIGPPETTATTDITLIDD